MKFALCHNKKGITSTLFNWIFVLIIGGVIFMFIMNIGIKQKSISEEKTARFLLRDLKSIIVGSKVSTSSTNVLQLPKKKIEYSCDSLSIGNINRPIARWPIFAPSEIEGRELLVWSEDWSVGYRVSNFLYLSNPEIRYVFVTDSATPEINDFIEDLFNMMPETFTKELVPSTNSIIDKKDKKVRVIAPSSLGGIPALTSMKNEDVTGLMLEPNPGTNFHTAEVWFYRKQGGMFIQEPSQYYVIENASMYAAIFTDDIENFECVMDGAFEEFNIITDVYKYRTEKLYDEAVLGTPKIEDCKDTYHSAIATFASLVSSIDAGITDKTAIDTIYTTVYSDANSLQRTNHQISIFSCPTLY